MGYWRGRRVLVTGATGLVGSWLTPFLLDQGARVVALVRDADPQSELVRSGAIHRTNVVNGALEDYFTIERAISEHEISTVFHLGAQAIVGVGLRSPLQTFESNIRGSYNLLEACRVHSALVRRVVVASSDKAYGDSDRLPYTEDMPAAGSGPYDVSKSCTDLLARTYATAYGLPVAIARCGNIIGGGDLNWSRIIPGTIRSLLAGERPVVRSNGLFTRDYIYVKDVVSAYELLARELDRKEVTGQAFNFGPKKPRTVLEVVDALRRIVGREDLEPMVLDTARSEIRDQYLCCDKARDVLGWQPEWEFEDGLRETVEWYRAYSGV